ncbi:hypothetical protein GCM10010910_01410 [Microbacterium nanhaiense]|uniref:Phage tail tape measure protein domain-containing protein n=1 Tax=Microbacterium nanhaiense TaxID=1301026 RepID=A0ABQ2MUR8_9MICO|nr:phage tail tape measure protein [Microbacterium nanhaiense]GGO59143.1 hypothetical protein GCM10010910_01410 [Microbacterium nanhaiense]
MTDRSVKVSLLLQAQGYMSGIQKASEETRKFGSEAEKLAAKRQSFEMLGKAAIGVGAGLVTASGLAVKAAMDWESAWAGVTKTVDGTDQQLAQVEDGLRSLTEILPASHEEIAGVAEAAGQLGVQIGAVTSFTKTMIDLGETTNLSADNAATSIAQMANVMDPELLRSGDGVQRLGSTLVALGNAGASTERDIMETATRISGAGRLVGASSGDVLALASAMTSMGITAELGGGVASRVLQDIYTAVEDGGDTLTQFARVAGMSASEFAAAFESDPIRALNSFTTGLNGVEASGGNVVQTLIDIGFKSSEEQRVLLQLKGAQDLLTDSLDLANVAWDENSALTDEANKRYETAESRIKIAGNAIKDASINIGSLLLPVLADGAERVGVLARNFADLPEPVQGVIGVLGGAAGAASLAAGAFFLGVPKLAEFNSALSEMGPRAQRAGRLLAGVTKAAGAAGVFFAMAQGASALADAFGMMGEKAKSAEETTSLLLDRDVDSIFEGLGGGANGVNDLTSALDELLGGNWDTKFNRWGSDLFAWTGLDSSVGKAREAFDQVGQSLADLVNNGQGDLAKELFDQIAASAEDQGYSVEEITGLMEPYQDALTGVSNEQKIAATTSEDLSNGFDDVGLSAEDVQEKVNDLADAIRGFGSAELSTRDAHRQFEQAYDDLTAAIEENGSTLDISTDAGRANEEAIDSLARSTLELAAATFEQTQNEEDAARIINDGRQALLDKLEAFGITGEAAEEYADSIGLIPDAAITEIKLSGVSEAKAELDALAAERKARITVTWSEDGTYGELPGGRVISPNATGNLYVGGKVKEFAAGGWASGVGMVPATPGGVLKVAEAGFDEAIISTDPKYRARSLGLLDEMSARLGVFRPSPDYVLAAQAAGGGRRESVTYAPVIHQRQGVSDRRIAQVAQEEFAFGLG